MLAAVTISSSGWLWPAIVFVVCAVALLGWSYRGLPVRGPVRTICIALKMIGMAALAACLLNPMWTAQRARPGANSLAIIADNSQGMQIKDRGDQDTRAEQLKRAVAGQNKWLQEAQQSFQIRRYFFDSRLQNTENYADLAFDGRASSLGAALNTLRQRFRGQPLAGVILFTDGNATDISSAIPDLTGLPPIHCVVVGRDTAIKDIAIRNVAVTQTAFEDAPVTIQGDVVPSDYAGAEIAAQVLELPAKGSTSGSPKVVAEQVQKAPRSGEPMSFRFQLRPEAGGVRFYSLRVAAKNELNQFSNPGLSAEATLANNARILAVDRGQGPYRILYVAGRPNWEYKFFRRALEDDSQLDLVGLIRIAKREPKFDFRGRPGESSNPLFRGFKNQSPDEVERYDQPVLVRLNTKDESELRGGFPKLPEDLFGYHAIVLDDLEAEFFSPDQMSLLQKFVSERGGGFLMLGGAESFQRGKYLRTPVGDMLPVYLDQPPEPRPPGEWRLAMTREGWLQPWARLRPTENEETTRLAGMPPFQVVNRLRGIKPGASAVATISDARGNSFPALVTQRFGHGRVAALTIGDMWRWGLKDDSTRKDMEKAWRQLVRWLVVDVPGRVEVQAEADANGDGVRLQVRARDKSFQPIDNAAATVTIRPVGVQSQGEQPSEIRLTAEASTTEPGTYETTYVPRFTAGYQATASVVDTAGSEAGRAMAGWASNPAADEFRSLKPNRALLESIAKATGGEVLTIDKLEAFAKTLPNRTAPITETFSYPIWHQPIVFLFALGCFATEWGLRRWRGLA
jgi:uncharacterized membrane protein